MCVLRAVIRLKRDPITTEAKSRLTRGPDSGNAELAYLVHGIIIILFYLVSGAFTITPGPLTSRGMEAVALGLSRLRVYGPALRGDYSRRKNRILRPELIYP
jgi:hypothetical protein